MNSLITKKITWIILVVSLGSILTSGIFINFALNRQFQSYLARMDQTREDQVLTILGEIYRENNGWPVLPTGIRMGRSNLLENLYFVADPDGNVVLYTRNAMMGKKETTDHLKSRPIKVNGSLVGTAYFGKSAMQDALAQQNNMFRRIINRSIILAIIFTGIISLFVAVVFAKRISTPITEMNQTAKNMTAGNLDTRVSNLPADELGELGTSLNQLADRLKQVEALRKKMTADVAHDLRTPLATVQSHLEGMLDEVIPASTANLESLLEEVKRLGVLVGDLQAIALADTAIHHFKAGPVELQSFLKSLVQRQTPLFAAKHLHLQFESGEPVSITADHDALAKIFDNLLSNAYKYTGPGKNVTVRINRQGPSVITEVIDEGIGITATDLPFIFERFYRTDQSRNRESGGFGLGLTIVKELVEALGGTISVRSVPDQGSTFTVSFPVSE